jgi:predicted alpha/beta-fold hydrolase
MLSVARMRADPTTGVRSDAGRARCGYNGAPMARPAAVLTKERVLAELARAPFRPAWWARSGALQTVAAIRPSAPLPDYASETWQTPDDDDLRVHFVAPEGLRADAPVALLLHGLEGDRRSPYAREFARLAARRGWRPCVMEYRSCGGPLNRRRRTYHSGETTDLAFVVRQLLARFPQAPLLVVGYSLGGNVVLKWLGEVGAAAPDRLVAAAAVSAPFELAVCAQQCDTRYGGAIARWFLRSLIPKAVAKARQFPGWCDVARVRACRTFRAYDDLVTAPVHGFLGVDHYYQTQGCGQFLPAIRRPALLLAAQDDPLLHPSVLPRATAAASPWLHPCFPARGGHVAFVDGGTPLRPRRWAEPRVLRFFELQLDAAGFAVS